MNGYRAQIAIILLAAFSLSASIQTLVGFGETLVDRWVLIAAAIGIELTKLSSIQYSYSLFMEKDNRAIPAVLLSVVVVMISIATMALYFDTRISSHDNSASTTQYNNHVDERKFDAAMGVVDGYQKFDFVTKSKAVLNSFDGTEYRQEAEPVTVSPTLIKLGESQGVRFLLFALFASIVDFGIVVLSILTIKKPINKPVKQRESKEAILIREIQNLPADSIIVVTEIMTRLHITHHKLKGVFKILKAKGEIFKDGKHWIKAKAPKAATLTAVN